MRLVRCVLGCTVLLAFGAAEKAHAGEARDRDSLACVRLFASAKHARVATLPVGQIVVWAGKRTVGAPYVAYPLEQPGEEQLIVNLRAFDCVTFVESMLAFARCVKKQTYTFNAFKEELRTIRYRAGFIDGYPSRLHYFSEWIDDNEAKGVVRNATGELGGRHIERSIDWMTGHREAYRQLADSATCAAIAEIEGRLSQRGIWFVPKEEIKAVEKQIQDGDIIALTSALDGLDVGHVGIAVRMKDRALCYLHAPLSAGHAPNEKGRVRISRESLADYVARRSAFDGIMIARPAAAEITSPQTKEDP